MRCCCISLIRSIKIYTPVPAYGQYVVEAVEAAAQLWQQQYQQQQLRVCGSDGKNNCYGTSLDGFMCIMWNLDGYFSAKPHVCLLLKPRLAHVVHSRATTMTSVYVGIGHKDKHFMRQD